MRASIALLIGAIALTGCGQNISSTSSDQNNPSIAETEKWINETYNVQYGGSPGYGHWEDMISEYDQKVSVQKCAVKISINQLNPNLKKDSVMSWNSLVSAMDVDLGSVEIKYHSSRGVGFGCESDTPELEFSRCDYAKIYFRTRNKLPLIRFTDQVITYRDGSNFKANNRNDFEADIAVTDRNYLPHFEKAFRYWLKSCGAKQSTF
jgi:hypothetical protein